jgi:hypothetical protein
MTLVDTIRPVVAEWKSNSRFRWGVWGIVGIVWLYGVLELRDQVGRKGNDYRAVSQKVVRAKSTATQEEWIVRRDEARTAALAWEGRLWREGTIGLAQATFHDWLRQLVSQAGVTGTQLTVAAQSEEGASGRSPSNSGDKEVLAAPGLWKVSARVAFDFHPQSFYPMLARLAGSERRVVIESLVIRSMPSPRAELGVVAYFQKPAAVTTAEVGALKEQK